MHHTHHKKAGARHRPARHSRAHKHTHSSSRPQGLVGYAPSTPAAPAAPGACTDTTLQPNSGDIDRIRAAVLCLVNRERAAHGEVALAADAHLVRAAQAHTESMASGNYFEHVGPGGDTPLSRIRATGYIFSSQIGYEVGENIGWGTLWQGTPRAIVAAWMASAGHRANILDARFRNSGIGVSEHPPSSLARHQAGGIYTQDFGVLITG